MLVLLQSKIKLKNEVSRNSAETPPLDDASQTSWGMLPYLTLSISPCSKHISSQHANAFWQSWLLHNKKRTMYIYSFLREGMQDKLESAPYYNVLQSVPILQWVPSPALRKFLLLRLFLWTRRSAAHFIISGFGFKILQCTLKHLKAFFWKKAIKVYLKCFSSMTNCCIIMKKLQAMS